MKASGRLAILAALVAIGLVYLQLRDRGLQGEDPASRDAAPAEVEAAEAPDARGPLRPVPSPGRPEGEERLPAPDASDESLRRELAGILGARAVERFVASEEILRKAVVTTDNLPHGPLPLRVRVVLALEGDFATRTEGGEIFLSPENYHRYTDFVRVVEALDAARVADAYARFHPLLQEAFEELGQPGQAFHDRLLAALDDLLRAPDPEPPIRLQAPRVVSYTFADPALESLSPGQKVLIRMGPENAASVKSKLREIRSELVSRSRELGPHAGRAEDSE